jgi:uncharacterized cupredoxin-like copper-binding protein
MVSIAHDGHAMNVLHFAVCAGLTLALPVAAHEGTHHHASASGQPGDPAKVRRTIKVDMSDAMRFTPAQAKVKSGETVRIVVTNSGKVKHEMVLGSMEELRAHAEMMKQYPAMHHEQPNQVLIEPGQSGEIVWQFARAGIVDFACLQPGHFDAGMKGRIVVR